MKLLPMLQRLPADCVFDCMESPLGALTLLASQRGLHAVLWQHYWLDELYNPLGKRLPQNPDHACIGLAKQQLFEYFSGQRKRFSVPLVLDGTEFQRMVWAGLTKIPYGKTISYQEQASSIGGMNKVRAVGGANARNPLSIVVPCHRVIAKSGHLQGFGGGLEAKRFLIDLEARNV